MNTLHNIIKIDLTVLGNQTIYSFSKTPLLNRLVNKDTYKHKNLIYLFSLFGLVGGILKLILYNLIVALILLFISEMSMDITKTNLITAYLPILTLIAIFSTKTFKATESKYNNVHILKLDAKIYAIIDLIKSTISNYIIITVPLFIILFESFLSPYMTDQLTPVYLSFYFGIVYLTLNILLLFIYDKTNKVLIDIKPIYISSIIVLMSLPFLLGLLKVIISLNLLNTINTMLLLTDVLLIPWLIKTKGIDRLYKTHFSNFISTIDSDTLIIGNSADMSSDVKLSKKIQKENGYKYFNDIFISRHKKILFNNSKIICIILLAIFTLLTLTVFFYKPFVPLIIKYLTNGFNIILIIILFTNRGPDITRSMYFHCDYPMLQYNFYRNKKNIINLFFLRLKSLIKINLIPAYVMIIGLNLLSLLTNSFNTLNNISLSISIIAMNIFFSVHFLGLYYLLQPYTASSGRRSTIYNIFLIITYYICYSLKSNIHIRYYGLITSIFVPIYTIIIIILVNRYAVKTFKRK